MKKEIGLPKGASKVAKREDAQYDKAYGVKEGSKKDLTKDKKIMKKFGNRGK